MMLILSFAASQYEIPLEPQEVFAEQQDFGSKLVGLSLLSDTVQLSVGETKDLSINITWIGDDSLTITEFSAGEFTSWFLFEPKPFIINVDIIIIQEFDNMLPTVIPQTLKSEGTIPFKLTIPPEICLNIVDLRTCIEEKIYSIPITIKIEYLHKSYTETMNLETDLRAIPISTDTIQNLLIGTIIIAIALGGGNFLRNRLGNGKRKFTAQKHRGYGSSNHDKKIRAILTKKSKRRSY